MSTSPIEAAPADDMTAVADRLTEMGDTLTRLETFITRRFAELSMEVNATSQQFDMAEEEIARRFDNMLSMLKGISHKTDETGQSLNTGVELEAVISATDDAATQILDSVGRVSQLLNTGEAWDDPAMRQAYLEQIEQETTMITVACGFQDIISQRVQRALTSLQDVEERLSATLNSIGIHVTGEIEEAQGQPQSAATQEEIDALFG